MNRVRSRKWRDAQTELATIWAQETEGHIVLPTCSHPRHEEVDNYHSCVLAKNIVVHETASTNKRHPENVTCVRSRWQAVGRIR